MLTDITRTDPALRQQELLHNAHSIQPEEAGAIPGLAGMVCLWSAALRQHYEMLCHTNNLRRQYLVTLIGGSTDHPPKGKYCTTADRPEGLSTGETDNLLAQKTGMSAAFLRKSGYNSRKRPDRASVEKMMKQLAPQEDRQEEFFARFGWTPAEIPPAERTRTLRQGIDRKWPGLSWDRLTLDGYLPLSGTTIDNVKRNQGFDLSTAYPFIIALGAGIGAAQPLYRAFGLTPLEQGEADGVAAICMGNFDSIILQMTAEYGSDPHSNYWESLHALLEHYDRCYPPNLSGFFFASRMSDEQRDGIPPVTAYAIEGGTA